MVIQLWNNFFKHKDFLPPPEEIPGTLFSPFQIVFCIMVAALIAVACVFCAKRSERFQKTIFFVLWLLMFLSEPVIIFWDVYAGASHQFKFESLLSLWPCSVFLFAAPFAIFGKGNMRKAACGYICTLGLLGGVVNFFYPANYLSYYSCFSMAGLRTVFYHGSMIFTAVTMLLSGYHSFRGITKWQELLLPSVPALAVSIPANIVNFTVSGADYMFFKLESFFFAPIGRMMPDVLSMVLVCILYLLIHAAPYLPSYISHLVKKRRADKEIPCPEESGGTSISCEENDFCVIEKS